MKNALLALCFVVLILPAAARIGETREECDKRYGDGIEAEEGMIVYELSGFRLFAQFAKSGRCGSLFITKLDGTKFSDNQIEVLLEANQGFGQWEVETLRPFYTGLPEGARVWNERDADGELDRNCIYSARDSALFIQTKEWMDENSAKKAATERAEMSGF